MQRSFEEPFSVLVNTSERERETRDRISLVLLRLWQKARTKKIAFFSFSSPVVCEVRESQGSTAAAKKKNAGEREREEKTTHFHKEQHIRVKREREREKICKSLKTRRFFSVRIRSSSSKSC